MSSCLGMKSKKKLSRRGSGRKPINSGTMSKKENRQKMILLKEIVTMKVKF